MLTAKEMNSRLAQVLAAVSDEMRRFNRVAADKKPVLKTFSGEYVVTSVNDDFWVRCYPVGSHHGFTTSQSFSLANDDRWAKLMEQVGEPRNPLFVR